MGLLDQTSQSMTMDVTVLLRGFQARGEMEIVGVLQTFLSDEQKETLSLHNVTLYGLEQGNPARSMQLGGLFMRKSACQVIAFDTAIPRGTSGLLPRTEQVAVYTSHYCIQGAFHMGGEVLLAEFIAESKSQFVGAAHVQIFPLFQPQVEMIRTAPLVFVHRDAVRMHHLV